MYYARPLERVMQRDIDVLQGAPFYPFERDAYITDRGALGILQHMAVVTAIEWQSTNDVQHASKFNNLMNVIERQNVAVHFAYLKLVQRLFDASQAIQRLIKITPVLQSNSNIVDPQTAAIVDIFYQNLMNEPPVQNVVLNLQALRNAITQQRDFSSCLDTVQQAAENTLQWAQHAMHNMTSFVAQTPTSSTVTTSSTATLTSTSTSTSTATSTSATSTSTSPTSTSTATTTTSTTTASTATTTTSATTSSAPGATVSSPIAASGMALDEKKRFEDEIREQKNRAEEAERQLVKTQQLLKSTPGRFLERMSDCEKAIDYKDDITLNQRSRLLKECEEQCADQKQDASAFGSCVNTLINENPPVIQSADLITVINQLQQLHAKMVACDKEIGKLLDTTVPLYQRLIENSHSSDLETIKNELTVSRTALLAEEQKFEEYLAQMRVLQEAYEDVQKQDISNLMPPLDFDQETKTESSLFAQDVIGKAILSGREFCRQHPDFAFLTELERIRESNICLTNIGQLGLDRTNEKLAWESQPLSLDHTQRRNIVPVAFEEDIKTVEQNLITARKQLIQAMNDWFTEFEQLKLSVEDLSADFQSRTARTKSALFANLRVAFTSARDNYMNELYHCVVTNTRRDLKLLFVPPSNMANLEQLWCEDNISFDAKSSSEYLFVWSRQSKQYLIEACSKDECSKPDAQNCFSYDLDFYSVPMAQSKSSSLELLVQAHALEFIGHDSHYQTFRDLEVDINKLLKQRATINAVYNDIESSVFANVRPTNIQSLNDVHQFDTDLKLQRVTLTELSDRWRKDIKLAYEKYDEFLQNADTAYDKRSVKPRMQLFTSDTVMIRSNYSLQFFRNVQALYEENQGQFFLGNATFLAAFWTFIQSAYDADVTETVTNASGASYALKGILKMWKDRKTKPQSLASSMQTAYAQPKVFILDTAPKLTGYNADVLRVYDAIRRTVNELVNAPIPLARQFAVLIQQWRVRNFPSHADFDEILKKRETYEQWPVFVFLCKAVTDVMVLLEQQANITNP